MLRGGAPARLVRVVCIAWDSDKHKRRRSGGTHTFPSRVRAAPGRTSPAARATDPRGHPLRARRRREPYARTTLALFSA